MTQEQRERATAHVESLRTRAREFKEQLTATKRDMRRAGRTLKTYEARQRFEFAALTSVMASSLLACWELPVAHLLHVASSTSFSFRFHSHADRSEQLLATNKPPEERLQAQQPQQQQPQPQQQQILQPPPPQAASTLAHISDDALLRKLEALEDTVRCASGIGHKYGSTLRCALDHRAGSSLCNI